MNKYLIQNIEKWFFINGGLIKYNKNQTKLILMEFILYSNYQSTIDLNNIYIKPNFTFNTLC